ncbi:MAG: twin-arginine translocation signal domain-containing protein [Acidimicrobiales bacterium]
MSEISRRTFLKQGGIAAAAAGTAAVVPKQLSAKVRGSQSGRQTGSVMRPLSSASASRPQQGEAIIVHVPDVKKNEVHLLFGTREVTVHDRDLVSRLNRTAS